MRHPIFQGFLLLLFFSLAQNGRAQTRGLQMAGSTSIFQTLVEDHYSEIVLKMNFDELIANKKLDEERDAHLTLQSENGSSLEMDIKVRPRGVFRRATCDMPPLRFNFDKDDLAAMGLNAEFDKLKLVLPCLDGSESEQYLLKEYWSYKLYNQLTPNSFRVHLVKMQFINSDGKPYQSERIAFLIEHKDELANRLGGEVVDQYGTDPSALDKTSYYQTMMFNYMIGNLDWDLAAQRNVEYIRQDQHKELIVVPYDFDFSAFVQPSYLRLNSYYGQRSVQDRVLIGRFEKEADLLATIQQFEEAKEALLTSFQESDLLTKKHKKSMTKYLQTFYTIPNDEEKMKDIFL